VSAGPPIKEVLLRVFVPPERFAETIRFYEAVFGAEQGLRFSYPERRLELASVGSGNGSVLIIAGAEADLAPFKATLATFHVRSLAASRRALEAAGGEVIEAPKRVPTGSNMRVRHPDSSIVEYVEHHD
jgi:predicted enzyme related to lactoylglutathione lyase